MKEIDAKMNQTHERDATFEEMREGVAALEVKTKYTVTKDILLSGLRADRYAMPLELRNGDDPDQVSAPINWLQSEDEPSSSFSQTDAEVLTNILMQKLTPVEKKVIFDRLGKTTGFPLSFGEISEEFGKTGEWARSTFNKAIKKMQIRARNERIHRELF
jgi:DNA-directed RNA polymerase sigma subunit (sigma70/sigma32)